MIANIAWRLKNNNSPTFYVLMRLLKARLSVTMQVNILWNILDINKYGTSWHIHHQWIHQLCNVHIGPNKMYAIHISLKKRLKVWALEENKRTYPITNSTYPLVSTYSFIAHCLHTLIALALSAWCFLELQSSFGTWTQTTGIVITVELNKYKENSSDTKS